ncbi:MAG TPA: helix-turn-helix domain-containing protein [Oscillospiraceae bacterium]|nr:helix-turn-helix domain-containing protein [Oscillospiraceae bacterium]HRW57721.1 helix-turn-helix domain-containing protein [Oscillospiraceae bacterium]
MADTKERILLAALRLFARDGYEAVSVSAIAGELGMTKSAVYKHYKNKRDIFDSIVARMNRMDTDHAKEYGVPEGPVEQMADAYRATSFQNIAAYTEAQFLYWTENEFSSNFRKMLTLEQYRNKEMSELYRNYLSAGPLHYMTDLFGKMAHSGGNASMLALSYYAPVFMLYRMYDETDNKEDVLAMLRTHLASFAEENIK